MLNHALGGTIKPLRLVEADTNPDLTSAFGGTADMGCCWARHRSKMTQTDWVNSIAAPKYVLSASGAQSASAPVRTGRTHSFSWMPPVEPHCRAWKDVAFWCPPCHVNSGWSCRPSGG